MTTAYVSRYLSLKKHLMVYFIHGFKFYSKVFEIFPLPWFFQTLHQWVLVVVFFDFSFLFFFGDLVRAFCTKPNVGNLQLDSLKLVCCWVTSNVQYFDFFLPQAVKWCYYFNVINREISNSGFLKYILFNRKFILKLSCLYKYM